MKLVHVCTFASKQNNRQRNLHQQLRVIN